MRRTSYLINRYERQKDILKLINQLDITPTMYNNAVEKYKAIASFLDDCGIKADMYPQGSFAFGTIVRPNSKNPDASYDLDFICQVHLTRDDISPSELRDKIQQALTSSDRYGGKLEIFEECFTIHYADVNGIGFTIDIVPATDENIEIKSALKQISNRPDLIETAIAIPRHNGERNYKWITNNPKGFKTWFDEINEPFLEARREEIRSSIYKNNRQVYSSVEEIPSALERSALQRVIQLLKYHRDVYYGKRKDGEELKPISAIINTLVADIAQNANPNFGTFELLSFVLNELAIYAEHTKISPSLFNQKYGNRIAITHENGTWEIQNPADPKDNLANKWNEDARIPRVFFGWISYCTTDLIESLSMSDTDFRTHVSNAFGSETIQKNWGNKYLSIIPKPINTATVAKPYRKS